jgi:clostripain
VPPNATGQDFTATCTEPTSTISGQVSDGSGNPVAGVTIAAGSGGSTITASDGSYTLSSLAADTYTLSATKTGCTFDPSFRFVDVPPNATGQDFTATCGTTASASWTFLLYMDGEDPNLYPYFESTLDNLEFQVIPSRTDLNIVVLLDGPQNGDTRKLVVQPRGNYTPNINYWDLGERNVGDPNTLQEFIDWGQRNYPADHYYLAVADHGNGVLGIAWDETDNDDYLTTAELGAAIAGGTSNGQRPIDVLHYDACLMGMLENAYQVKDYADHLIFSQNLGWSVFGYDDYVSSTNLPTTGSSIATIAANTTAATTPRQLAENIAAVYHNSLNRDGYPHTISVLDLSKIDTLQQEVNALAQVLNANMSSIETAVQNTRNMTQMFDSRADYNTGPEDDYADLYDLAQQLEQNVSNSSVQSVARSVMSAVDAAVITEYHAGGPIRRISNSSYSLDNAHGISIYFPPHPGSSSYNQYIAHESFSFTAVNDWDDFLENYFTLTELAMETGDILKPVPLLGASPNINTLYLPMVGQ